MTLSVSVLGPVTVERADVGVAPAGAKVRMLLAVLVAQRGGMLSTDRLCEAMWGDVQPGVVTTVHSHMSAVADDGPRGDGDRGP